MHLPRDPRGPLRARGEVHRAAIDVACGPREVDPNIHSAEEWCAWARGPDRERLEGRGSGPHDALLALTVELKESGV